MPKFETEFVYCMWNENLKGKNCFLADSIVKLQERVESNDTKFLDTVVSRYNGDYPFRIDNGNYFRFCYYDPYYDLKLAREQGKVIQRYCKSEQEWDEYIGDDFPDDISFYRIKPEEQMTVTCCELAQWLAQGSGEWSFIYGGTVRLIMFIAKAMKTISLRKQLGSANGEMLSGTSQLENTWDWRNK